jgi:hypothetical protein
MEVVLGKFIVDLAKLLSKELQSWKGSRRQEAAETIAYIDYIAYQLDKYIANLTSEPSKDGERLSHILRSQ